MNWVQEAKNQIANGYFADALKMFAQYNKDEKLENQLLTISAQWNELRNDEIMGILSRSDERREKNVIMANFLKLLDRVPSEAAETEQSGKGNSVNVQGDGSFVIQGVTNSTIIINK